MADTTDINEYYSNLLIVQYHEKAKAKATIELLVNEIQASAIYTDVRDGYDLETAAGAQLDIIGKYVGVSRSYQGYEWPNGVFALVTYPETMPFDTDKKGLLPYADFDTGLGETINYNKTVGSTLLLNDSSYRTLIKLKILQNNIDHSHKSIDDGLFKFFGTTVRADSTGDMVMFYFIPLDASQLLNVAIEKDILPRPMGVKLQYFIREDTTFFGMSTYSGTTPFNTGFSDYSDFDSKEGETLVYSKLVEP